MVCDRKFQIFWAPFPSPLSHKIPLKGSPKYFQFQVFHFFSKLEKGAMLGMSPDNFVSKEHQQIFACCYIWVSAYYFVEFPWFISSSGLGENVGKLMFNWSVHIRPSLFLLCKWNWHTYMHVRTFCLHSQVLFFSSNWEGPHLPNTKCHVEKSCLLIQWWLTSQWPNGMGDTHIFKIYRGYTGVDFVYLLLCAVSIYPLLLLQATHHHNFYTCYSAQKVWYTYV